MGGSGEGASEGRVLNAKSYTLQCILIGHSFFRGVFLWQDDWQTITPITASGTAVHVSVRQKQTRDGTVITCVAQVSSVFLYLCGTGEFSMYLCGTCECCMHVPVWYR